VLSLLFFRGGSPAVAPIPPPQVVVGGSGKKKTKPKHYWEVEQERQESYVQEHFELPERENTSLLQAQIELEKARSELERRRSLEQSHRTKKEARVFADAQAEKAYQIRVKKLIQEGFDEDEAIFLLMALDD
jgi:hypothetical protein